ncbi:uncharacterized protein si:dkey-262k9.2 [Chanodichthys erythropterus]|uniref:uncharacterized protein si:dkey-262k9.2 n=1 Tax=Chanodichthys erythropterus TaxID=933992 RepID=UPI00351DACFB
MSSKASVGNMQIWERKQSPTQGNSSSRNKKMLRLLILFLILQGSAATSEDTEGNSSGFLGDDEDGDGYRKEGGYSSPVSRVTCRQVVTVRRDQLIRHINS